MPLDQSTEIEQLKLSGPTLLTALLRKGIEDNRFSLDIPPQIAAVYTFAGQSFQSLDMDQRRILESTIYSYRLMEKIGVTINHEVMEIDVKDIGQDDFFGAPMINVLREKKTLTVKSSLEKIKAFGVELGFDDIPEAQYLQALSTIIVSQFAIRQKDGSYLATTYYNDKGQIIDPLRLVGAERGTHKHPIVAIQYYHDAADCNPEIRFEDADLFADKLERLRLELSKNPALLTDVPESMHEDFLRDLAFTYLLGVHWDFEVSGSTLIIRRSFVSDRCLKNLDFIGERIDYDFIEADAGIVQDIVNNKYVLLLNEDGEFRSTSIMTTK